ncbi:glyoxalase [Actinophytocola xinjiangensis]|uniref:Glyoxalase n=1 Tax=Actinophytocola xinjiangensis TaxID=485602 RepID=A0A7Z0WLN4_9PSEU|nr:VOC family protein [Actinophytocola xinjiangensis]OLF10303.1 glyoxalase [Actinophytocola xinjiangensis]
MSDYLFAGIPVNDYPEAVAWYGKLLGSPPAFHPHDTEAVWEIADNRAVYVVLDRKRAGHALITVIVDDLDARLAAIAERGLEPALRETYDNGTRKITFRDPDGNEFALGGVPSS